MNKKKPSSRPVHSSPAASTATREFSMRSRGSSRGSIISDNRIVTTESEIEHTVLLNLSANRDVMDLREQPQEIRYVDDDGIARTHTPDAKVTMRDGQVLLIAIKPKHKAMQAEFIRTIELVAANMSADDGDSIVILHDRSFSPAQTHNAKLINCVRQDDDVEADDALTALAVQLNGSIAIQQVVETLDIGPRGFRAVVRAIDKGLMRICASERIQHDAQVQTTH